MKRKERRRSEEETFLKIANMISGMDLDVVAEIADLLQKVESRKQTHAWLLHKLEEADNLNRDDPGASMEDIFHDVEKVYLERKRMEVKALPYTALLTIKPSVN